MDGIKFNKRESLSKDCKIVRYGTYQVTEEIDGLIQKTKSLTSIDEFTFYKIYLQLNNVVRYRKQGIDIVDMRLADTPLELLAHIMCKDENYTLIYRNKDSKLQDIANELDKTVTSIYTSIGKLRKAGYLVNTEDGFCVPNAECRELMKKTKAAIKDSGHLAFNYLFKFCVQNKNTNEETT